MSVGIMCPNCGEEYDIRYESCPACTIAVEIRDAHNPALTWNGTGHYPFEVHGERFAVTACFDALGGEVHWRVSHVETGTAIPGTTAKTKDEAAALGQKVITQVDPVVLKRSVEAVRRKIAAAKKKKS